MAFADQDQNQSAEQNGYSEHWFSATGYGPNDDQANDTRALNNEQLQNHGAGGQDAAHSHDRDMQGPSDNDQPADTNDQRDDRSDNGGSRPDDAKPSQGY